MRNRIRELIDLWSFAVFFIKSGEQKGHVGENAVEYFNFD